MVADVKAASPEGLGAHAVILLAVAEGPFQQAVGYVRSYGTIVAIGLPAGAFLKAPVFDTVVRMVNIRGSYVGNRQDGVEAIDFFARGLIHAPFKTASLKDLPKIFELMGMFLCPSIFFLFLCVILLFVMGSASGKNGKLIVLTHSRTRQNRWSLCVGCASVEPARVLT